MAQAGKGRISGLFRTLTLALAFAATAASAQTTEEFCARAGLMCWENWWTFVQVLNPGIGAQEIEAAALERVVDHFDCAAATGACPPDHV
jgi:hypothetical protein